MSPTSGTHATQRMAKRTATSSALVVRWPVCGPHSVWVAPDSCRGPPELEELAGLRKPDEHGGCCRFS
eukprot:4500522-Alexandrium_andersonii.AAC.1